MTYGAHGRQSKPKSLNPPVYREGCVIQHLPGIDSTRRSPGIQGQPENKWFKAINPTECATLIKPGVSAALDLLFWRNIGRMRKKLMSAHTGKL